MEFSAIIMMRISFMKQKFEPYDELKKSELFILLSIGRKKQRTSSLLMNN